MFQLGTSFVPLDADNVRVMDSEDRPVSNYSISLNRAEAV